MTTDDEVNVRSLSVAAIFTQCGFWFGLLALLSEFRFGTEHGWARALIFAVVGSAWALIVWAATSFLMKKATKHLALLLVGATPGVVLASIREEQLRATIGAAIVSYIFAAVLYSCALHVSDPRNG